MRILARKRSQATRGDIRLGFIAAFACLFSPFAKGSEQEGPPGSRPHQPQPRAAASPHGTTIKVSDATPEDALKTFMLALMAQDGAALRAVTVPHPELEWLLKGDPAPVEVIKVATAQFAEQPIKRLREGEKVILPRGREYVVSANEVGDHRAVLLPRGATVPTRLHEIKGHWKIVSDPFIASRKAADARKKAQAKKTPPGK